MATSRRVCHIPNTLGVIRVLLPSFIANTVWPEKCPHMHHFNCRCHRQKVHETSYLDGLRGAASIVVFFCHYTEKCHSYFLPTYGLNGCVDGDDREASSILQLPFIRVMYSGRPMVHIFFVISGFVLAYKPLRLLHHYPDSPNKCYDALASSSFRRSIRLFLPCAVSTLGVAVLCQTGQLYAADTTWSGQLHSWAGQYAGRIAWSWAWDYDLRPGYNIHLWTIPIEFANAMLLFIVMMTLSRLRTHIRQAANIMLAGYCLACGKWAAFEFLVGLFLAELHILRKASKSVFAVGHFLGYNRQLSHTVQRRILAASHNLYVAFHATILGVCLFVAGWPNEDADKSPGIRVLQVNTPAWFLRNADSQVVKGIVPADGDAIFEQKFWFGVTAVGIVWSCGELTAVRRLFETPPAQYCGRISYAMYLVHGPALDYFQEMVLGRPAVRYMADNSLVSTETGTGIKGWIGVETPTQRVLSWLVGVVVLGGIIVWIADLFWRFVDAPIVKLGQAVERACTRPIHAQSVSLEAKEHNLSSEEGISVLVG